MYSALQPYAIAKPNKRRKMSQKHFKWRVNDFHFSRRFSIDESTQRFTQIPIRIRNILH